MFAPGGRPITIAEATDGLSTTFMLVEDAGRPDFFSQGKSVGGQGADHDSWADPENRITIEAVCGGRTINCHNGNEIYAFHTGGANFLMGDGSVRFIRQEIAPAAFKALFTCAAGDIVSTEW